jgi:hypothetical protein
MSKRTAEPTSETGSGPSPLAGLLFLIGGIGGLFGLVSAVDPLL